MATFQLGGRLGKPTVMVFGSGERAGKIREWLKSLGYLVSEPISGTNRNVASEHCDLLVMVLEQVDITLGNRLVTTIQCEFCPILKPEIYVVAEPGVSFDADYPVHDGSNLEQVMGEIQCLLEDTVPNMMKIRYSRLMDVYPSLDATKQPTEAFSRVLDCAHLKQEEGRSYLLAMFCLAIRCGKPDNETRVWVDLTTRRLPNIQLAGLVGMAYGIKGNNVTKAVERTIESGWQPVFAERFNRIGGCELPVDTKVKVSEFIDEVLKLYRKDPLLRRFAAEELTLR